MSQEQPQKPRGVKYGDVFHVSGELASKPIAPQDAAALQSAENTVLGRTIAGGAAEVMQSAAEFNERRGVVQHQDMNDVVREKGAAISGSRIAGYHVVSESIGGQVVGRYAQSKDVNIEEDHEDEHK